MLKPVLVYCVISITLFIGTPGICAGMPAKSKQAETDSKKQPAKGLKRYALVIGNNRYEPVQLKTPANDAHIVAAALRRIGFTVEEKSNLNAVGLKRAVTAFGKKAQESEVALFYFSGHGIQFQGKNFLMPVNERITSDKDIRSKTVAADLLLGKIPRSGKGARIIVLDASREKPPIGSLKTVKAGLAPMEAPPGTLVAFSAMPDKTTIESNGSIGIYTKFLVQTLDTPGLSMDAAFKQIRSQVEANTGQNQSPWDSNSFPQDIFLVPPFDPTPLGMKPAGTGDSPPLRGFTDAFSGMEFVPVPGGCFSMGDTFNAGFMWEQPVHVVCVSDFSIGKYEVTQGQWNKVLGTAHAYFNTCGDDCPVEQVSWNDAQEFIRELNKQTGGAYRLPTEAEWEYAARSGGRNEMFSGGIDVDSAAWHNQNSMGTIHKVGTRQPNGLGIYDMSGNVWEWVQDWYDTYRDTRQMNPTGPDSGVNRVFRGGAWSHGPSNARTAIRYYNVPDIRINFIGFRLAGPPTR